MKKDFEKLTKIFGKFIPHLVRSNCPPLGHNTRHVVSGIVGRDSLSGYLEAVGQEDVPFVHKYRGQGGELSGHFRQYVLEQILVLALFHMFLGDRVLVGQDVEGQSQLLEPGQGRNCSF